MLRLFRCVAIGMPIAMSQLLLSGCGGGCSDCSINTPPPAAPTEYLAIEATPDSAPDAGPTDLYVIPSKSPGTAPIHVASYSWLLGLATLRRGDGTPVKHFYTTYNEKDGDHLWSLDLTGKGALTPVQVSNLSFPLVPNPLPLPGYSGAVEVCSTQFIRGNLNDPDSVTLLMSLPDPTKVCSATTQIALVHPGDSATTAPTTVTLGSNQVLPLYQATGALAGIVALDDAQHLNFYPDATFTHPTQLLSDVTSMSAIWQEPPALPGLDFSAAPTYAYLVVKSATSVGAGGVYRVDSTGAISGDLYDFQNPNAASTSLPLVKDDIVYFCDSGSAAPPRIDVISHGSAAETLYTTKQPFLGPSLAGPAGQQLILQLKTDSQSPALIQTLPIGAPGVPTTIDSQGDVPEVLVSGNDLLVTYSAIGNATVNYSTQILDSSGAVLRAAAAGSAFLSAAPAVLQATNIPTGVEIDALDLRQPASNGVPLKTAAGATFTLPANADPILIPYTSTMGIGRVATGTGPAETWVYDLSTGVATPVVVPNYQLFIE
jgi:hypothetical protein